jgi:hypothetical protein
MAHSRSTPERTIDRAVALAPVSSLSSGRATASTVKTRPNPGDPFLRLGRGSGAGGKADRTGSHDCGGGTPLFAFAVIFVVLLLIVVIIIIIIVFIIIDFIIVVFIVIGIIVIIVIDIIDIDIVVVGISWRRRVADKDQQSEKALEDARGHVGLPSDVDDTD